MKFCPDVCSRAVLSVAVLLVLVLLGAAGCSRGDKAPRADNQIDGGKVVITGARPQFPAGSVPSTHGFLEELNWNSGESTLAIKGWAPLDVRPETVRLVLRDPFDQLRLEHIADFAPHERPDVLKEHPHLPGVQFSGFTATLEVAHPARRSNWPEALEMYCLTADGAFYRLHRADAPSRESWDRRSDRFEIVLTYAMPELEPTSNVTGSLDAFEATGEHRLRLAGWAPFDGQSPNSVLIVQLPPTAAPASIVSCVWFPRPDVRAAIAPAQAELERSGFDLTLQIRTSANEMARAAQFGIWAIDARQNISTVALTALEQR